MQERLYEHINVRYYEVGDILESISYNADYIIVKTDPDDIDRIVYLEKQGFLFHNRTILGEINITTMNKKLMSMIRGDMRSDKLYSEDMYTLAKRSFVKDRRFHLTKEWDQHFANKILKGYLNRFSKEDTVLFKCFHNGKLIGFTVVKRMDNNSCENVLGAVDPLYQNRGAAIGLYTYMLKELKNKGYKKLYGRISTTNIASINLHNALGAKYSKPEDEFIFRGEAEITL